MAQSWKMIDNSSNVPWRRDHQMASDSFAAELATVDGLKTFPVVAQKALSVLSNPDFRVPEVTALLKQDPSLAGGIMRMANSAFFVGTRQVSTIQQAFIRLGRRSVQEVIAAVATMDLFPDTSGIGKRFRDHCAATAAIVQSLARLFMPKLVDGIFISGLMHDVGKMLLIESGEFDYELADPALFYPDRMRDEEEALLAYDHAILGAAVLERWHLPEPIPWIVAWHHRPTMAYAYTEIRMKVALLRIADRLDYIITNELDEFDRKIGEMDGTPDLEKSSLTVADLIESFEGLIESRSQSLSIFGG
jgi:putative nucleotidyltransferase with HDIG domain